MPANPVNFDGTNDYAEITTNLTGAADGQIFLISCWFRILGGAGTVRRIFSIISTSSSRLALSIAATNVVRLEGRGTAGALILGSVLGPTPTTDVWHHIAISGSMASTALRSFYYDGVAQTPTWGAWASSNIDFSVLTTPIVNIGRYVAATPEMFNGDLADLYFTTPAAYFDLSVPANLAKLVDPAGPYWVDLGADASSVTGTQPLVYMAGATAGWHTNKGSGGGFTLTGALTDGAVPVPTQVAGAAGMVLVPPLRRYQHMLVR
jgi:hypothetical protein